MTLRKKTIDISVEHIAQTEQTQERDSKPNTIKNISIPRKQKKIHKIIKNLLQKDQLKILQKLKEE